MAELRQSLHALVERPPAAPAPIEVVVARGTRYARRRRRVLRRAAAGLALVAVGSFAGLGASQDREHGVVLGSGGRTTAGYIAERPGGYIALGTWTVTITRGGRLIELSSTSSEHCGRTGVILPGDEVRGSITGPGSTLRVGERFTCPD